MALPQGINFRSTAGYVTNGASEYGQVTPGTGGNYPTTTPQGNTVGWEGTAFNQVGARDRSTTVDKRLAGTNFSNTAAVAKYRIDLPGPGAYNIRLAAGDASFSASTQIELFDDTVSLGVLAAGSLGSGVFMDAAGATYSSANWPSQNSLVSKTFNSSVCRIGVGSVAANNKVIAHFYIEAATQLKTYVLQADPGVFIVGGPAVVLRAFRTMSVAPGSFSLTGTPSALATARRLSIAPGSFALSGAAVGLTAARRLLAGKGAFALSGASAALRAARRLAAAPASFSLTGAGALLTYQQAQIPDTPQQYRLSAASGSFGLAGKAVMIRAQRRMPAAAGVFALVGSKAALVYDALPPTSGGPVDVSKIPSERIVVFEGSGSRVVVFEGIGSRVVIFEGSGSRVRFQQMNVSAKVPVKVGDKWTVDRDPDEISYYAADITQELLDRNTTADSTKITPVLFGVELLEGPSLQVATVNGAQRTFVVVQLGGVPDPLPADWRWVARVSCMNSERFDKTTWFNKVDP